MLLVVTTRGGSERSSAQGCRDNVLRRSAHSHHAAVTNIRYAMGDGWMHVCVTLHLGGRPYIFCWPFLVYVGRGISKIPVHSVDRWVWRSQIVGCESIARSVFMNIVLMHVVSTTIAIAAVSKDQKQISSLCHSSEPTKALVSGSYPRCGPISQTTSCKKSRCCRQPGLFLCLLAASCQNSSNNAYYSVAM